MLNEFRSTSITWDKATRRIYSPITANESDSNGRKLNIQVVNSGQVENLTGATLHLYWETKDKTQHGLDAFAASDISKGEFEIFYTTAMLSNVGELNATLVLVDSTGKVVSDWFKITVARGINEGAIESENSFSSLTQALIDISNLEQNYAPRLNDLTAQLQQTEQSLNAQLAQTVTVSNVKEYPTIQEAFNNGGIVYFPKGEYTIESVEIFGNTKIIAHPESIIRFERDIDGFVFNQIENLEIIGLTLSGTSQKGGSLERNNMLLGKNVKNLVIKDCTLLNGANGFNIVHAENFELSGNKAYNFSGWPFSAKGQLKNVDWFNNNSHFGLYDGLKMSGYLLNVSVHDNNCTKNNRDGFDFAGHSVSDLAVYNNKFHDNTIMGMEVKTLDRAEYPLDPNYPFTQFKNIAVYDNQIYRNERDGVNIATSYSEVMDVDDISVYSNKITSGDFIAGKTGIRVYGFKMEKVGQFSVYNNEIKDLFDIGVRVINSKYVGVYNNDTEVYRTGIHIEVQLDDVCSYNHVTDNDTISNVGSAILLSVGTDNNVINENKTKSPNTRYRISDLGVNNTIYNNRIKDLVTSSIPVGRAVKGEIVYSSNVLTSGCIGWVCIETGSSTNNWKPFGLINV